MKTSSPDEYFEQKSFTQNNPGENDPQNRDSEDNYPSSLPDTSDSDYIEIRVDNNSIEPVVRDSKEARRNSHHSRGGSHGGKKKWKIKNPNGRGRPGKNSSLIKNAIYDLNQKMAAERDVAKDLMEQKLAFNPVGWYVNPWALNMSTNGKKLEFALADQGNYVLDGCVTYNQTTVNVLHTFPLFDGGDITDMTDDNVLVKKAGNGDPIIGSIPELPELTNFPIPRNKEEHVKTLAHSLVPYYMPGRRLDYKMIANRVEHEYLRLHRRWDGLKQAIFNVVSSDEFLMEKQQMLDKHMRDYELKATVRLTDKLAEEGRTLPWEITCARADNLVNTLMLATLAYFLYHMTHWLMPSFHNINDWHTTVYVTSIMLLVYSFSRNWRKKAILRQLERQWLNLKTVKVAMRVKNAKIRPIVVKEELLKIPLDEDVVIKGDFPPEPLKPTKPVEIYGTYISGAPVVYPDTGHQNLVGAVTLRMAKARNPNKDALESFRQWSFKQLSYFPSFDVSGADYVSYFKTKYPKLVDKFMNLRVELLTAKDLAYEIFVKREAYCGKDEDTMKPRMIWSAPDKVKAKFGAEFQALSKQFSKFCNGSGSLFYTSGATPDTVAQFATNMFKNNVYESDVSSWDGSLDAVILDVEKEFLKTKVVGMPSEVDVLLKHWTNLRGHSKDRKVKVTMKHGRRSGDPWTSVFNTLINFMIVSWVTQTPLGEFEIMALGDDNVFSIDNDMKLDELEGAYKSLGMKCEIVPRESILTLTYCSGRFWSVNGKFRWGNSPFKVLSKFGWNHYNHPKKHLKGLLYGTAKSMLCTAGHIPIVGAFLRAITNSAEEEKVKARYDSRSLNPYRIQGGVTLYPGLDTYKQFSMLYDVSIETLMAMEEWIECNININDFPYVFSHPLFKHGFEVDTGSADEMQSNIESDTVDTYDWVVNKVPMIEEMEKLEGVNSILEAYYSGYNYGMEENVENNVSGHEFLHAFWAMVSYVYLPWGIGLHSAHNAHHFDTVEVGRRKRKKTKQPTNKPPPRRRNRRRNRKINSSKYADMISDPCGCELLPGLNGTDEGLLSRLKTTFAATVDNGYVLWCPAYAPEEKSDHMNAVIFTSADSVTAPLNTVAAPFGSGVSTASPEGRAMSVGAADFMVTSTPADMRVLSACIRMRYNGKMTDVQGEVAYLENIATTTLLDGLPTVDQLFNIATRTTRMGLETNEVVYRPHEELAGIFKNEVAAPMTVGTPAVSSTVISNEGLRFSPTLCGFAFRSLGTVSITLEFIQNIEWRPEVNTGFVSSVPRTISSKSHINTAVAWLDKHAPGWSTTFGSLMRKGANKVASSVYAYGANMINSSASAPLAIGWY